LEGALELPRRTEVEISRRKVTGYLLATGHPIGGAKAKYFESRGYRIDLPDILEAALRDIARHGDVASTEATSWGTKYFVVGSVRAPDGNQMELGTVWIVAGEGAPALVTAYPTRR